MTAREIMAAPGVELAGPIPAEIQLVQVFAAAIVTGSKEREAATRLTEFLASDGASAAIQKSGMEQVGKRGTN